MKVFILGATGCIGCAVSRELIAHDHQLTALSRSAASDAKLQALGITTVRGEMQLPEQWIHTLAHCQAVIQVAATFDEQMASADALAMRAIEDAAVRRSDTLRLIYTGGCWSYGATDDSIATEATPFNPLPPFAFMARQSERLLAAQQLRTAIIHPAMVYAARNGVFDRFIDASRAGQAIEIWGSAQTRWPLVHRDDLAVAYRLLLEQPDLTGHFNASAEAGVPVGDIAESIRRHWGVEPAPTVLPIDEAMRRCGDWAAGCGLDQQMGSGKLRGHSGWRPVVNDYRLSDVFEG